MPDKKENKLFSFIDRQINPDYLLPMGRKVDQGCKSVKTEQIRIISLRTK